MHTYLSAQLYSCQFTLTTLLESINLFSWNSAPFNLKYSPKFQYYAGIVLQPIIFFI